MSFYGKIFNDITHELNDVLSSLFNIFKRKNGDDNGEQLIFQLSGEGQTGVVDKEISLFQYDDNHKKLHIFCDGNLTVTQEEQ